MIPLFVPSSFGDIVSAANIVHSIYKALSDSMGASHDYQCLITELRSLEQALRFVDRALAIAPSTGHVPLDIAAEITTCLELLKRFHDRIGSYQKLLGGGKGASWRKIGWSLFKADEVASFRQKISQHKQNIALFLNGLIIMGVSFYADEARQSSASSRERLLALEKQLPEPIRYGDGNSVTVINAFGNPMRLPLELCFSPDKLHDLLMTYFKGKLGEDHVKNHKYNISTKNGKSLVQANNWSLVVKVGRELVMSMIVEKLAQDEVTARAQRNACPHCNETDLGVMEDEGWLRCRRCERQFISKNEIIQVQDRPRDHGVVDFRNIFIVLTQISGHFSNLPETPVSRQPADRIIIHNRPRGTHIKVFQSSKDVAAYHGIPETLAPTPRTTQSAIKIIQSPPSAHILSSDYLSMLSRNASDDTNVTGPVAPLPTSVSPEELTAPVIPDADLAKSLLAMLAPQSDVREMVIPSLMDDYSPWGSPDKTNSSLSSPQDTTMDTTLFHYLDDNLMLTGPDCAPPFPDVLP